MRLVVSKHPLHRVWRQMRQRCTNPNDKRFSTYGARGIKVCKRWDSFAKFLSDVGERPSGKTPGGRAAYQLDRINNDKCYTPENVRWLHYTEQHHNKTTNRVIRFRGESMTLARWAERMGIKRSTLSKRLKMGWRIDLALTSEVRSY